MNKLPNTPENKARFFAQYWGQNVFTTPQWKKTYAVDLYFSQDAWDEIDEGENKWNVDNPYLLLTPLLQISDEDLEYVTSSIGYVITGNGLFLGRRWLTPLYDIDYSFFAISDTKNVLVTNCIIDYLRSKGYALPWMGLSVEDLIAYGWVQLKGETR